MREECPIECGVNKFYNPCGVAQRCDRICKKGIFCPQVCLPACTCIDGYKENSEGVCVLPEECPSSEDDERKLNFYFKLIFNIKTEFKTAICGANEEWSQCDANPDCQLTCDKPYGPLPCPKSCVSGCKCIEGYVKDIDGNCVPIIECNNSEPKIRCLQDIVVGPCKMDIPRFAYDQESRSCVPFTYGGCRGNLNRFYTLADCENFCYEYLKPESNFFMQLIIKNIF